MATAVVFDTIAAVVAFFTKHDDVAMILCCMTLSLLAVNARFDDIESQRIAQADRKSGTEPEYLE
jgi:Trk K+ transport system NAD-binding subunit